MYVGIMRCRQYAEVRGYKKKSVYDESCVYMTRGSVCVGTGMCMTVDVENMKNKGYVGGSKNDYDENCREYEELGYERESWSVSVESCTEHNDPGFVIMRGSVCVKRLARVSKMEYRCI